MKLLDRPIGIGQDVRSDAELIEAMQGGDENAYGVLFTRHSAAVVRFATSLTRDESTAEDVASEAFLRVFEMLDTRRVEIEAFRPYVLRAARNVFLNRVRRDSKIVFVDDYTGHDMDLDMDLEGDPDDPVRDRMVRAFESLPSTWQEVLWRTEVEGERPRHIAPSIGISPNATAALAVRAREGLRQEYLKTRFEGTEAPYDSFFDDLVKWVRGAAGRRASARVSKELDDSPELEALAEALRDEDRQLKCAMWLALIGCAPIAAFGAASATIGIGGSAAAFAHTAEGFLRNQLPIAASVTAVVVATGVAMPVAEVHGELAAVAVTVEAPLVPPVTDGFAVQEDQVDPEDPILALPDDFATAEATPGVRSEEPPVSPVKPNTPVVPNSDTAANSKAPAQGTSVPAADVFVPTDINIQAGSLETVKLNVLKQVPSIKSLDSLSSTASVSAIRRSAVPSDGNVKIKPLRGLCGVGEVWYGATDHRGRSGTGKIFVHVRC